MSDVPTLIETWFADHQDGEFCCGGTFSCSIFPPTTPLGTIVYATKPQAALRALEACDAKHRIGVAAPSFGLPPRTSCAWLSRCAAAHTFYFLGDMDPADLMIFAWLRACLPDCSVRYLGLGDRYLHDLNVDLPESHRIACSPSEREALHTLSQVLPDYRKLIGEQAAQHLAQGQKIEIEAVVSALGSPDTLLQPALGSLDA